jgi:hypothetical protein
MVKNPNSCRHQLQAEEMCGAERALLLMLLLLVFAP